MTPFHYAIHMRNYSLGLTILKKIILLYKQESISKENMKNMICSDWKSTNHPLLILLINKICVGKISPNTDVYDCLNCGIKKFVSLCSVCAMQCHQGHQIVKKQAISSAYCDCSKKKCISLNSFDEQSILEIFKIFYLYVILIKIFLNFSNFLIIVCISWLD